MKKTLKILSIILIAILMISVMSVPVMASEEVDELFTKEADGTDGIMNVGGRIVDIVTTVGIIVAVIVLLVLGIKYMMGSAAEKAEYKKTMIPYLVGALLIFGASAIAKAIIAMSENLTAD
jgi:type IV secretory pathway VirB2 component (pilin)